MELSGEFRIRASRQVVWDRLNDPEVLSACIAGCEALTKDSPETFTATVRVAIGPVKAKFSGSITLADIVVPESYTISGQGNGGIAGFAKGSAEVKLEEDGDETVLRYAVRAQVGGKLAQLGGRLIQSTAGKYARDFFEAFANIVNGGESPIAMASAETAVG